MTTQPLHEPPPTRDGPHPAICLLAGFGAPRSATELDGDKIALLRDGTEALVGVLASVAGLDEDTEYPLQ